jgi:serine acetyltransferase
MPKVTVGQYALIGAYSLVKTSVPEGEIWFGTPARFVSSVMNLGREHTSSEDEYPNII